MSEHSIAFEAVSKRFPTGGGLRNLTLRISSGTAYGLLGMNGAGKSTLLHLGLGYLRPDAGSVRIVGIDPSTQSNLLRAAVAYVPESARLYTHLTGLENLTFFDGLMRHTRTRLEYLSILDRLRFPKDMADERFGKYSKGMRHKVVLALGLLKGATVFLLDEPTSGLDPLSADDFAKTLRTITEEGKTVIFTSHDLQYCVAAASRLGILREGRLIAEYRPDDLLHRDVASLFHELDFS